jgi:rod shape-determining protein MreC
VAGPDKRRSRRASTVTALLSLTALALLSLDSPIGGNGGDSPLDGPRSVVAAALGPLEEFAASASGPLRDGSNREQPDPVALAPSREFNDGRLDQLDALLGLTSAREYQILPAQVIAISPAQSAERTVAIDVGTIDGVTAQMTVVNGDGLIGRVVSVGPTTATVQLIIDAEATIGARLETSQQLGIATGRSTQALAFALLDPLQPVAVGDRVVSFGSAQPGSPYVGGIPIGNVTSVRGPLGSLDRTATIKPAVDFTALDLVGVLLTASRTQPREPLAPTPTGPTPGATP